MSMTGDDLDEYVRQSRTAQGLPPTITDEDALHSFAAMVAAALTRARQSDVPEVDAGAEAGHQ
jgi:hypothetical protein